MREETDFTASALALHWVSESYFTTSPSEGRAALSWFHLNVEAEKIIVKIYAKIGKMQHHHDSSLLLKLRLNSGSACTRYLQSQRIYSFNSGLCPCLYPWHISCIVIALPSNVAEIKAKIFYELNYFGSQVGCIMLINIYENLAQKSLHNFAISLYITYDEYELISVTNKSWEESLGPMKVICTHFFHEWRALKTVKRRAPWNNC